MKGLNSVYEIQETRKSIFLRIVSTIYTLVFAIMIIASIILFIFGNRLCLWIETRFSYCGIVYWYQRTDNVGLVILLVFFLIIYIVIPNRKTRMAKELPGAGMCGRMVGFSYASHII